MTIQFRLTAIIFFTGMLQSLSLMAAEKNASHMGHEDFENYCGSCHGLDGKGNGPMASELKAKPADLTQLAKKNGGDFPYRTVRSYIDGQTDEGNIRSHGSREMPVWGKVFRSELGVVEGRRGTVGAHAYAKAKILNIVDYLDSIQE